LPFIGLFLVVALSVFANFQPVVAGLLIIGVIIVSLIISFIYSRTLPKKTTAARVHKIYAEDRYGGGWVAFLLPDKKIHEKWVYSPTERYVLVVGDIVKLTYKGDNVLSVLKANLSYNLPPNSPSVDTVKRTLDSKSSRAIYFIVQFVLYGVALASVIGIVINVFIESAFLGLTAIALGLVSVFFAEFIRINFAKGGVITHIETKAVVKRKFPITNITPSTAAFWLPNQNLCTLDMSMDMYNAIKEGTTVQLQYRGYQIIHMKIL